MKKIALIVPSLQAGGMERVMSELAEYFASTDKIEVHILLYGISRELFYPLSERIIVHKPHFEFDNRRRVFSTIRTLFFLRKKIQSIHPETILSFGEYWNSFVIIALWKLKFPVYISDRCQPDKKLGKYHDWLRVKLYPRAAGIIAQTEKAKEIYQAQFKQRNIKVIGNPIRTIKNINNIPRENIVLMVGRLIKTKHQDKLIELFINISKPGWKLVIVGYDHLKQNLSEELRRIINENDVANSVFLEGKQADVESYYLKSKIFAFTSSSEGFPVVIGEAMSARLPVIAFDCVAGPSEMIDNNENGFLIPLFDYEQFQAKLELLMEDPGKRQEFGNKAFESIQKFSISIIGKEFHNFILS